MCLIIPFKSKHLEQQEFFLWRLGLGTKGQLVQFQHGLVSTNGGLLAGEVPVHPLGNAEVPLSKALNRLNAPGTRLCGSPLTLTSLITNKHYSFIQVIWVLACVHLRPVCKIIQFISNGQRLCIPRTYFQRVYWAALKNTIHLFFKGVYYSVRYVINKKTNMRHDKARQN